jgi:acetyl esterase/lipase
MLRRLFSFLLLAASTLTAAESIVYKSTDNRKLHLHIEKPSNWKPTDKRPAVVFFFGGGWVGGSAEQFLPQSKSLADQGAVGIRVEYRTIPKGDPGPPLVCCADAKSAMRFVRSHAADLGIDPTRIAAAGGSAGGHLAAFTALVPGLDDPADDSSISCKPDALILFNPVFNNGPGQWGHQRLGNRFREFSPAHHISKAAPPTCVFLGDADKLIGVPVLREYEAAMKAAGARCDAHVYPNAGHGFFNKEPYLSQTTKEAIQFLVSLGWLKTAPTKLPLKIFILAGQSNMEGQAVVDLTGKDYNEGKGTLAALLADPAKAAPFAHLRNADGKWTVRDDVWVRYQREQQPLLHGPLGVGFAVYGGSHHFGPELQFGHVVGNALDNPVLLIKTAWGGKSLYRDFRPPSSGGTTGPYYTRMLADIRTAITNIPTEFPDYKDRTPDLAGFVWYHGWNDGVDPKTAVPEYEQNLTNLIKDVRRDLRAPNLPVVIGEITGPWVDAPPEWEQLRKAQAATAALPEFSNTVAFAPTRSFVRKPEDSPNPGHGHHEFGNAETIFLVGDALGKAMLPLLPKSPP